MQTLGQIKELLEAAGLSPRKALGQNFLIDKNLITKLIDASGVMAGEFVLEVGPGTGALTEALLERGCHVVACELDAGLADLLRHRVPRLGLPGRFVLVEGDCLAKGRVMNPAISAALDELGGVKDAPFALVANLPYGAATPLMLALLADHPHCRALAVTIQREVADRMLAPPGSKEYGVLGIVAQAVARVERIASLPPECFWPRPEVTSAMALATRLEQPLTQHPRKLADIAQTLFSKRRKQIGAILRGMNFRGTLPRGVPPEHRPEALSVAQWVHLAEQF